MRGSMDGGAAGSRCGDRWGGSSKPGSIGSGDGEGVPMRGYRSGTQIAFKFTELF